MNGADLAQGDLAAVAAAMAAAGAEPREVLTATLIAGGRSNLTYALTDGTSRWVLRTPPRRGATPSAHDVAREHRVTSALARTAVPVARPVVADSGARLGVPFTVSDYVEGRALRTQSDLDTLDDTSVRAVVHSMICALAELHEVDRIAIGLADFGRPDAYAARQLRRWVGQWERVGLPADRTLAADVVARLERSLPAQRRTSVVHGDYRIDNTLVSGTGVDAGVAAIVDWELSTIGDPAADVAMMCAYTDPAFDLIMGAPSAWTSDRLPSADGLATAYAEASGHELPDWEFHRALACFKVAVIAAGIDHRRHSGAGSGPGFDTAAQAVPRYLELAREHAIS